MKHIPTLTLFATAVFCTTYAWADVPHTYTNQISAHNIAAFQQSIITTAQKSFNNPTQLQKTQHAAKKQMATYHKTDKSAYGRPQMYGTMPMYGEFNDDGTGRSGGDTINSSLDNIWINWDHAQDNLAFDNIERIDSDYDNIMFGLSGGATKLGTKTFSQWGTYTGYIDAETSAQNINIDTRGGYLGIYNSLTWDMLNIATIINGGVTDNAAEIIHGTDNFTNFWLSGNINATYNIVLDKTFVLQPGVWAGYTWIKSDNYTSISGDEIASDNFSIWQIAPNVRATKYIGSGWTGSIGAKHVMTFMQNGDLRINNAIAPELESDNYTEYDLRLEKSIGNVMLSVGIGRRDGGRDGWIGSGNIKIQF